MTDLELKQHVEHALMWEPSVDSNDIGISVGQGVVTLRGNVPSFSEKGIAERVTLHTYGVKAVANDWNVRLMSVFQRSDTDIAQAAVAALQWHAMVPKDGVAVAVSDGLVALKGAVEWQYQKDAAIRAIRDLTGVTGVTSDIIVKQHPFVIVKLLCLLTIANGTPVIAKNFAGNVLSSPIDGGLRCVDGQRLLGSSKTVRGLLSSILATSSCAPLLGLKWRTGFLVGNAAMAGDVFSC